MSRAVPTKLLPVCLCVLLAPRAPRAEVPESLRCAPPAKTHGCFQGDIFVLDGSDSATCQIVDPAYPANCEIWQLDHARAVEKVVTAVGSALPVYDQLVVWAADFATADTPRFFRVQGKNQVAGIGLPVPPADPFPAYRFTGWITGGSTGAVADPINQPYPPGSDCLRVPFGLFDDLARATANLHGPWVDHQPDPAPGAPHMSTGAGAWHPALDLGGGLMGGRHWRDNGNRTLQTAWPIALRDAGRYEGRIRRRFDPVDLYLMGLLPREEVPPMRLIDVRRGTNVPGDSTGGGDPRCLVPDELRVPDGAHWTVTLDDVIANPDTGGPRAPGFAVAPHHLRQLWIAVTLPATVPAAALARLESWRRSFGTYFYMLTHWRGRAVTTFEGNIDDSAYWQFGQPSDDRRSFVADGGLIVREPLAGGVVVVDSAGPVSRMRITGPGELPISLVPARFDAVLVRMRVAPGALPAETAHALVSFPGGPQDITLPGSPDATLVPDGQWRTYSADLGHFPEWYAAASFGELSLAPSDTPGRGIEIDFVQLVRSVKPGDNDLACGVDKTPRPDGWIDDLDNCPKLYNPGQEDQNHNGMGDACEDYDGDGALDACDNCVLRPDSTQKDRDKDGLGDVCDSDPGSWGEGCCMGANAVGGRNTPDASAVVFAVGLVAALIRRQRR